MKFWKIGGKDDEKIDRNFYMAFSSQCPVWIKGKSPIFMFAKEDPWQTTTLSIDIAIEVMIDMLEAYAPESYQAGFYHPATRQVISVARRRLEKQGTFRQFCDFLADRYGGDEFETRLVKREDGIEEFWIAISKPYDDPTMGMLQAAFFGSKEVERKVKRAMAKGGWEAE